MIVVLYIRNDSLHKMTILASIYFSSIWPAKYIGFLVYRFILKTIFNTARSVNTYKKNH